MRLYASANTPSGAPGATSRLASRERRSRTAATYAEMVSARSGTRAAGLPRALWPRMYSANSVSVSVLYSTVATLAVRVDEWYPFRVADKVGELREVRLRTLGVRRLQEARPERCAQPREARRRLRRRRPVAPSVRRSRPQRSCQPQRFSALGQRGRGPLPPHMRRLLRRGPTFCLVPHLRRPPHPFQVWRRPRLRPCTVHAFAVLCCRRCALLIGRRAGGLPSQAHHRLAGAVVHPAVGPRRVPVPASSARVVCPRRCGRTPRGAHGVERA
eukprot:5662706-Pleurochrysis_carterae.AAC.1